MWSVGGFVSLSLFRLYTFIRLTYSSPWKCYQFFIISDWQTFRYLLLMFLFKNVKIFDLVNKFTLHQSEHIVFNALMTYISLFLSISPKWKTRPDQCKVIYCLCIRAYRSPQTLMIVGAERQTFCFINIISVHKAPPIIYS